MKRASNEPKVL